MQHISAKQIVRLSSATAVQPKGGSAGRTHVQLQSPGQHHIQTDQPAKRRHTPRICHGQLQHNHSRGWTHRTHARYHIRQSALVKSRIHIPRRGRHRIQSRRRYLGQPTQGEQLFRRVALSDIHQKFARLHPVQKLLNVITCCQ